MDLTPYVSKLREELMVAADAGGEDARALADRLTAPLESAIRLLLLEALGAAADEITRELAPGSVELRLRGLDPNFVVTPATVGPWAEHPTERSAPVAPSDDASAGTDKGETVRINLRLPEDLKVRIDDAAARERVSINTWLVRAAAHAIEPGGGAWRGGSPPPADEGRRYTGWVR
ncbi:MAG TPA: toxin-antitoxin system HicB family antitoxin [Micromonosporaceae bacterium]|nr:toxin-antitoxin system HicB family antitoxin [Micromonosporaceae bacterium]